jgi:hypothetical protein
MLLTPIGNHDITLDTEFYNQYGPYFHNQEPQDTTKCQDLFARSSSILYLKHEAAVLRLSADNGPKTTFKVFGSPYSPASGMWAFGYTPDEATQLWDKMPLDSDIVITHTPPKFHRDERSDRRAAGCEALRCMLWRVRPRLAICGHIHESRGAEIISWDLGMSNIKYKEAAIREWVDPGKGNKKMSLIDLTTKGPTPLVNDGSHESETCKPSEGDDFVDAKIVTLVENGKTPQSSVSFLQSDMVGAPAIAPLDGRPTTQKGLSHVAASLLAVPTGSLMPATLGQGGLPPSNRCDLAALSGRLGRRETCVVNAAIMASSYPYSGTGGKKFNKPIVVDIDLPGWV